jgi:hypothetical protein
MDPGPGMHGDPDVKSENGMSHHGAMQYQQQMHYSPMMPQMQHSPVMHHAHHHGSNHQLSASLGNSHDFSDALVEKMMLDLRRASTGSGLT